MLRYFFKMLHWRKIFIAAVLILICGSFLRNPFWVIDYQACRTVKKLATEDLNNLIAWVDHAKNNYLIEDINDNLWNAQKIEWYKSTEKTKQWLEKNSPLVLLYNINSGAKAKSWSEVNLIGLSNGPDQQAFVKYKSKSDIAAFSNDHQFKIISPESAVFCGSRFLSGS